MINFQYQSQLNSSTLQKRDIVCYKDVELSTKKGKKKENFQRKCIGIGASPSRRPLVALIRWKKPIQNV